MARAAAPLACTTSRPAPGGCEYLANVGGRSYGDVCPLAGRCAPQTSCWSSRDMGVLCMPDADAYCVVDTGGLPPGLRFMVAALQSWGLQLDSAGPSQTLDSVVFAQLYQHSAKGATAAPWAPLLLDGQPPLTPCAAPGSAPVPTCWQGVGVQCYKSYLIPRGMYLAPGASFPVPVGQGYYFASSIGRKPCRPAEDDRQRLYWTQASGGRYCKDDGSCVGAPADAQPVWHTKGQLQNPSWICSFVEERCRDFICFLARPFACKGATCIGDTPFHRHDL